LPVTAATSRRATCSAGRGRSSRSDLLREPLVALARRLFRRRAPPAPRARGARPDRTRGDCALRGHRRRRPDTRLSRQGPHLKLRRIECCTATRPLTMVSASAPMANFSDNPHEQLPQGEPTWPSNAFLIQLSSTGRLYLRISGKLLSASGASSN
jgi:hypothetical protein